MHQGSSFLQCPHCGHVHEDVVRDYCVPEVVGLRSCDPDECVACDKALFVYRLSDPDMYLVVKDALTHNEFAEADAAAKRHAFA